MCLRAMLRPRFWAILLSGVTVLGFVAAAGWVITHQLPGSVVASVETDAFNAKDRRLTPGLIEPTSLSAVPPASTGPTPPPAVPTGTASGSVPRLSSGAPTVTEAPVLLDGEFGPPSTPPAAGNPALSTPPAPPNSPASPPPPPPGVVTVRDDAQLQAALNAAGPGTVIALADGTYGQPVVLSRSGTASAPIVVRGSPSAVLRPGRSASAALRLDGASHVRLEGFSVRGGLVGVLVERSSGVTLRGLDISESATDGIRIRSGSADTVVENSRIHDTGRVIASEGGGVSIGSAGSPGDGSDRTIVRGNVISNTGAESVRAFAGTSNGTIQNNTFGAAGAKGRAAGADSWVDIAGNGYRVTGNRGTSTSPRIQDGLTSHVTAAGWGRSNTFSGNDLRLKTDGYGIFVEGGPDTGSVVACDNSVTGARAGRSNLVCA